MSNLKAVILVKEVRLQIYDLAEEVETDEICNG